MKINSINTYNQSIKAKPNPNFGMAKFMHPVVMKAVSKSVNSDDAIKIFSDVKKSGCKNSLIGIRNTYYPDLENYGKYDLERGLYLSFPRQKEFIYYGDFQAQTVKEMQQYLPKYEKILAEKILYNAAIEGKLDKVKSEMLEDLPEITDVITKYSNIPEIQELNENGKMILQMKQEAIENYKKAHPILSKFSIPKF